MKKLLMRVVIGVAACCISAEAGEKSGGNINPLRFVTCENNAGAGFFWVDSTCGKVWWASPADCKWIYYGSPDGAANGNVGRYVPYQNKSGAGLFVLDSVSGDGWWTNGREWKKMGKPEEQQTGLPATAEVHQ